MKITERKLFGKYIVADPKICHGKLTFVGTRIFVKDILEMVSEDHDWDYIIEQWHNSINAEAIAEAVQLARRALLENFETMKPESDAREHSRREHSGGPAPTPLAIAAAPEASRPRRRPQRVEG